jgi:hypothetical protein
MDTKLFPAKAELPIVITFPGMVILVSWLFEKAELPMYSTVWGIVTVTN